MRKSALCYYINLHQSQFFQQQQQTNKHRPNSVQLTEQLNKLL